MEYFLSKVLKDLKNLLKRFKKRQKSLLLLFLGLIIFFFGIANYYRIRILSFTKTPTEAVTSVKGELPTQITIPSIKIDLSLDIGDIKGGVWQISDNHATFLDISARPGTGGNVVIYGHNKKIIFGNLPYLNLGQKIYIKTTDNKIYIYEVYKKDFVNPDVIDLVSSTNHEELTVFTCWGLFDQQRAVVKAKPLF